jgi:ABC-2 type transport system ATP-binding protein
MLILEHVSKTYDKKKKAVDDISLHVRKGEIFGFIGPNGAGKTTTIKMITGILKMTSGAIRIDGTDISEEPIAAKRKMTYVPDTPDVQKKLKGIEYVNFIADMYDVSKEDRKARTAEYAKLFGMTDALYNPISGYSHGMQQKIVLIGALITDPQLLVLDEPMVGLDPKSSYNLKELMKRRVAQGKTVFFSTHVLEVAEKFCDRVAIIANGKLIAQGTLEELRAQVPSGDVSLEQIFLELTDKNA